MMGDPPPPVIATYRCAKAQADENVPVVSLEGVNCSVYYEDGHAIIQVRSATPEATARLAAQCEVV
jgi:hypothetical protein